MGKDIPKINLGFFQDGLKINSKKFHPLNMTIKGIKLESDKEYIPVDAMDILDSFTSINVEEASKADKVKVLKAMLEKVNR